MEAHGIRKGRAEEVVVANADPVEHLGQGVVPAVHEVVEDSRPLVGHPDLVDVRKAECEGHVDRAVVLDDLIPLAADVTKRFLHIEQQTLDRLPLSAVESRHVFQC